MKATREQCEQLAKVAGVISDNDWLMEDSCLANLVHLAQQFTLDQLRAQEPYCIDREYGSGDIELHRIPETLE
jgi:hypothetical protein